MTTLSAERVRSGTTISIRDVSLFVDVVGRGHPLVLMHGGPGGRSLHDAAVPALQRSVHPGLLRPSLQWTINGRARFVDDLGQPDGGCRRAAPEARFRQVGCPWPFVRR